MRKFFITLFAMIFAILPLSSCTETSDNGLTKVRLNEVTHSIFYAPLYIAMENDFFKDEGLEIELTNGGGADKSMTAILSGEADMGLMGVEACMYVYLEGKTDYPMVFGQLTKRDGSFLISKNDEPDFEWADLAGKEVLAGRQGGVPAMSLETVVNKHGLINGQNITLNHDVAFPLMGPAFESGTGDYTTLFEPTASEYVRAGKGHIVASVGEESGEVPFTAFMALDSYITENEETIESFIRAMYKAMKYLQTADEDEVAESLLKQFPDTSLNSVSASLQSYKNIDAWMTNMSMTSAAFNNLQDIMENCGELSTRIDDHLIITNNSYAQSIYEEIFG